MKKVCALIFTLLLASSPILGDEIDTALGSGVSGELKASTRAMIQAGLSEDDALRMTRLMMENRFRVENMIRAQEIVKNALGEGIPAEPVMNKAREGIAKRVHEDRILQAMEQTRSRYSFAYERAKTLAPDQARSSAIGESIAEAMAAGLSTSDVDAIRDMLQTRTRDMDRDQARQLCEQSFLTAREMVRSGVSGELARDAVGQAIEHRYQARDMEMMRNTFMNQVRSVPPDELANRYAHAIRSGADAVDLGSAEKGKVDAGFSGASDGISGVGSGSMGAGSAGGSGGSGGSNSGSGSGGSSGRGSGASGTGKGGKN
ncbi:MAG TPA: hypothetical protein ENN34_13945 [Deltaproteobacteria bacterium]|nr:hypothetical protein [Deltaproteobacteria bacterium]